MYVRALLSIYVYAYVILIILIYLFFSMWQLCGQLKQFWCLRLAVCMCVLCACRLLSRFIADKIHACPPQRLSFCLVAGKLIIRIHIDFVISNFYDIKVYYALITLSKVYFSTRNSEHKQIVHVLLSEFNLHSSERLIRLCECVYAYWHCVQISLLSDIL